MHPSPCDADPVVALTGHQAAIAASAIGRRRHGAEGCSERRSLDRPVPVGNPQIDPVRW